MPRKKKANSLSPRASASPRKHTVASTENERGGRAQREKIKRQLLEFEAMNPESKGKARHQLFKISDKPPSSRVLASLVPLSVQIDKDSIKTLQEQLRKELNKQLNETSGMTAMGSEGLFVKERGINTEDTFEMTQKDIEDWLGMPPEESEELEK